MATAIRIPPLPVAHMRAMSLVGNPEPSQKDLQQIVDSDPALTAALLRAANSAISAPLDPVRTAHVAIVRVGTIEARRIIMGVALSNSFHDLRRSKMDEHELWRHLIATGILADVIAWGEVEHTEAFTAGLLHDLGRLAMAVEDPGRYSRVVAMARSGQPAAEAERLVFGLNHMEWGQTIARTWGFPVDVADAIADHHEGTQRGLAWAVTRAREVAASLGIGDGILPPDEPPPDSEAALLPIVEELGGKTSVLERVDWYGSAVRAA